MRIAPVTKEAVLLVVAATVALVLPLTLTMMPMEEPLKRLIGVALEGTPKNYCTMKLSRASMTVELRFRKR